MTTSGSRAATAWTDAERVDPESVDEARDLMRQAAAERKTIPFVGSGSSLRAVDPVMPTSRSARVVSLASSPTNRRTSRWWCGPERG